MRGIGLQGLSYDLIAEDQFVALAQILRDIFIFRLTDKLSFSTTFVYVHALDTCWQGNKKQLLNVSLIASLLTEPSCSLQSLCLCRVKVLKINFVLPAANVNG